MHKVKLVNSKQTQSKKCRLRDRTDRAWFSRLARHPARKRSGSILTTPEPARNTCERKITTELVSKQHFKQNILVDVLSEVCSFDSKMYQTVTYKL